MVWRKQNENMDPSCLVPTVQAGGGGGGVMFSWHTLGPLVPIGHRLNATAYQLTMSIPLWPPCPHPLATSSRIMHLDANLKMDKYS